MTSPRKFPFPNRNRLVRPFFQGLREAGYTQVWVKFGDGQIEIVTNSKDAPKVIRYSP